MPHYFSSLLFAYNKLISFTRSESR